MIMIIELLNEIMESRIRCMCILMIPSGDCSLLIINSQEPYIIPSLIMKRKGKILRLVNGSTGILKIL